MQFECFYNKTSCIDAHTTIPIWEQLLYKFVLTFFKTHTLTHTGKGAESTGQGQTGIFLSGPVFYRICWLMTPPMVSAASCFICAVAWV